MRLILGPFPQNIISCYIMAPPTPSVTALNQLYASLSQKAQQSIAKYLNTPGGVTGPAEDAATVRYNAMTNDVFDWLDNTDNALFKVMGGGVDSLNGLRVQVVLPDGVTVLDTNKAKSLNTYANINIIDKSAVGGELKFKINENQASRSYNMGASLSNSGVFSQEKYSKSTGTAQYYLAVRQGATPANPLGNVIVSMDA